MTYRPRKAPGRRVYHRPWQQGYLVNSKQGSAAAKKAGYDWGDFDHHLSLGGEKWVNAHGAPEKFWGTKRFESQSWAALSKKHRTVKGQVYSLRTGGQTLHDNARLGLKTEFEVKDVRPYDSLPQLERAFQRLAVAAQDAYGKTWREHVVVKVLTNLSGGEAFALRVCQAAHGAGFKTMLLARGRSRYKTFAGKTYVDYVRGSVRVR